VNGSPTVSVLIACYNAAWYVSAAINSVLVQTWDDLEIIVVDDGSTDNSREVLSGFTDPRMRVIAQQNAGASSARNRAFAASSGSFVIYFDADDIMGPRHLESLVSCLRDVPDCIAFSRWSRFQTSLDEASFPARPTEKDMAGVDWILRDWANARPMTQSGMFLIPRVLIEKHGGWDLRLSLIDDFEFFARILSRSAGLRFAPNARLFYRSGVPGTLSQRKDRKAVESAYLSVLLGTQHLLDAEDSSRTRKACANVLRDFEYTYYPDHSDLRASMRARVAELGGSNLEPDGPPGFHKLRRLTGWKIARRVERMKTARQFLLFKSPI
jgi:glycosyltransferase involved in cell wall biosynthesis